MMDPASDGDGAMGQHKLHRFFWPRAIAVLGASPDAHRIRGRLLRHLRENQFPGPILPIDPSHAAIDGLACYPSIGAVDRPVDLALIAMPAAQAAAAVEDCARAGVRHALILSSGFAEAGGAAGPMRDALTAITRTHPIRVCGPDCDGFFNAAGRVAATFSPTVATRGDPAAIPISPRLVAVIAQSGGIGFTLFNRGKAAGIGFSHVISTGDEADLEMADFLDYMIEDEATAAVILFCVAVRDGPAFVAALAKARRSGKPVIAITAGRSGAGMRATASRPGSHSAYRAIFERYGVIEAEDADDAIAIAGVMVTCPLPKGRRVGIVTVSGGAGAWMADTLPAHGLIVQPPPEAERSSSHPLIPSHGAAGNPLDVTAPGSNTGPAMMAAMEHLAASDAVDMLVLVASLASTTRVPLDAARIRAVAKASGKPITVWSYTPPSPLGRAAGSGSQIFTHTSPRACGRALAALADHAEAIARPLPTPFVPVPARLEPGLPKIAGEYATKQALAAWLPAGAERLVASADAAAEAASRLGYPVVLKIQSASIPRKTEAGRVHRALRDRDEVVSAYDAMLAEAASHDPQAVIDGVLVQRMAPKGQKLVIAMMNDPTFGPIMTVAFGGAAIELFGDVIHAPAPIGEAEAIRMILRLKSAPLLTGFHGSAPIDLKPVATLLAALSRAALTLRDQIEEFSFNPVIVHADGSGLTVADGWMMSRS